MPLLLLHVRPPLLLLLPQARRVLLPQRDLRRRFTWGAHPAYLMLRLLLHLLLRLLLHLLLRLLLLLPLMLQPHLLLRFLRCSDG